MEDLLRGLDDVEEELTEPDRSHFADPRYAKAKDRLRGGFLVRRVLGSGSTARVFEVDPPGGSSGPRVLKVALDPEHNHRLEDEMEVLQQLRHSHVVAVDALVDVGERKGILMEPAGETLERRLREEGPFELDDLRRLGDELLQVVEHLEETGVDHRDLKPANLGLRRQGSGRLQLVVFDFSLSRVPADKVLAGTLGYLDPFLRRDERGRWDVHAERFAAAVTLYEMSTGTRPIFGDGRSDPALAEDAEPRLDADQFQTVTGPVADGLCAFFRQALAPHFQDRFDTCDHMLQAWRRLFIQPIVVTEPSTAPFDEAPASLGRNPLPADLDLGTPLELLSLSTRARGALQRDGAATVGDVLRLPLDQACSHPNVGTKTRRELASLYDRLRRLFPDVPVEAPAADEAEAPDLAQWSLDRLVATLAPKTASRSATESGVLAGLLASGDDAALALWPSQSELAQSTGVSRARVGQVVAAARKRWAHHRPALTRLRDDIAQLLEQLGGLASVDELVGHLLTLRGSVEHGESRRRRGYFSNKSRTIDHRPLVFLVGLSNLEARIIK